MASVSLQPENHYKKCLYDFGDMDWCELPEGHSGNHSPFEPKCPSILPGTNAQCMLSMGHYHDHKAEIRWPQKRTL